MSDPSVRPTDLIDQIFDAADQIGMPIWQITINPPAYNRGTVIMVVANRPVPITEAEALLGFLGIGDTQTQRSHRSDGRPYAVVWGALDERDTVVRVCSDVTEASTA